MTAVKVKKIRIGQFRTSQMYMSAREKIILSLENIPQDNMVLAEPITYAVTVGRSFKISQNQVFVVLAEDLGCNSSNTIRSIFMNPEGKFDSSRWGICHNLTMGANRQKQVNLPETPARNPTKQPDLFEEIPERDHAAVRPGILVEPRRITPDTAMMLFRMLNVREQLKALENMPHADAELIIKDLQAYETAAIIKGKTTQYGFAETQ